MVQLKNLVLILRVLIQIKFLTGDGDILTENRLWDMKVIKNNTTHKHTLQVLVYYLMGRKSKNKAGFKNIDKLGLFNPRLNKVYYKYIEDISFETIQVVERDVIGYS